MVRLNIFSKSVKSRKRVARGGAYGGTSGRGHKGYKARSGSVVKGFEGGQTPIYRRLPMRGFNSNKQKKYEVLSLKKIIALDKAGVEEINNVVLSDYGVICNVDVDVKIIGSDVATDGFKNLKKIDVSFASSGAVKVLKQSGVELVLKNS